MKQFLFLFLRICSAFSRTLSPPLFLCQMAPTPPFQLDSFLPFFGAHFSGLHSFSFFDCVRVGWYIKPYIVKAVFHSFRYCPAQQQQYTVRKETLEPNMCIKSLLRTRHELWKLT